MLKGTEMVEAASKRIRCVSNAFREVTVTMPMHIEVSEKERERVRFII